MSDSPEMGVELYLASMVVTGEKNADEQKYLSELASELKLDPALVQNLRTEIGFEPVAKILARSPRRLFMTRLFC